MSELVNAFNTLGHTQAVVAGIYPEDTILFPENIAFHPVYYHTSTLPYAILGMSDEMPYESTRYSDLTASMIEQFKQAFLSTIKIAVDQLQPDLIICHHLYLLCGYVAQEYPQIPVYGQCHGSDLRQFKKNPLLRLEISTNLQALDGVFALHQTQADDIATTLFIDPAKIHVTGSGYNPKVFFKNPLLNFSTSTAGQTSKSSTPTDLNPKVSSKIDPVPYSVIYAGKLTHKKGVMDLISALDLLSYPRDKFALYLAGGTSTLSEQDQLATLISNCPYPVNYLGLLNHHQLAAAFNQVDLFILPSFYEGLPLVLMEALACGCSAICTNLPGIKKWYDTFIPHHHITFIDPPTCCYTDEPVEECLPLFRQSIATGIINSFTTLKEGHLNPPNLSQVTWEGLAIRILNLLS